MKPEVLCARLRPVYNVLAILMFVLACVAAPALTAAGLVKLLDTLDTTSAVEVTPPVLTAMCPAGEAVWTVHLTGDNQIVYTCLAPR